MSKSLIFIVDDDPVYGEIFKKILEAKNYQNVELLESGEKCLENLHKKPALIILDFSLSGINGLDAVKAILAKQSKAKVVILTSLNRDEELVSKCYEAGIKGYFQKNAQGSEELLEWMDKNVSSGLFSFLK